MTTCRKQNMNNRLYECYSKLSNFIRNSRNNFVSFKKVQEFLLKAI